MAYTFAKTISDADILAGGGPAGQTTYNRRLEKAIATTDVPHVFALSYSYELPFGRGRRWLNDSGWATAVLGGWVLTGIHQYSVGHADRVHAPTTRLPLFTGVLRPNVVADASAARVELRISIPPRDFWINRAAFRVPAALRFGTAARSYTDLRNPSVPERKLRPVEEDSALRTVHGHISRGAVQCLQPVVFAAPQANISNAQFGRISARPTRPGKGKWRSGLSSENRSGGGSGPIT